MSEYNLTVGQAIDLMLEGKTVSKWGGHSYHYSVGEFRRVSDGRYLLSASASCEDKFREVRQVKMITWYKPTVIWFPHTAQPERYNGNFFYKTKEEVHVGDWKVLQWEEIQAPDNYDDCK
jgi:hypothetical protein